MARSETRRILAKGQVTIPYEVREKLGWSPATEVSFEVEGESLWLHRASGSSDSPRRSRPPKPIREDPFIGLWKDREDLQDSTEWVRETREREWA